MTSEQFVKAVFTEQKEILATYFSNSNSTEVSLLIKGMNLSEDQIIALKDIMRSAFTDLAYTLLLGLDGEAQIGGIQHTYQLLDEEGNKLAGEGEIGSFAWEYFHGKDHSD